ncbi:hypothetical protein NPIL_130041 [Nephila pilipes]|uniref:Uncharacterized protein n=1 Tax=Nephila pilipes TaxID=299642 RepID=A0A8X6TIU9_NEPPI|nr:hypothetical protein NPIL_130041 [Nephila pilipes]
MIASPYDDIVPKLFLLNYYDPFGFVLLKQTKKCLMRSIRTPKWNTHSSANGKIEQPRDGKGWPRELTIHQNGEVVLILFAATNYRTTRTSTGITDVWYTNYCICSQKSCGLRHAELRANPMPVTSNP